MNSSTKELYQWVKASERLPESGDTYHCNIRMIDGPEETFPDGITFFANEWEVNDGYEVVEWLEKLALPTQQTGWVSVDKDLPKESRYYLIHTTAGIDKVWYNHKEKYFGQHEQFKWLPNYWMPLPIEPSKD